MTNTAPVTKTVDITYDTLRFNGSLLKENIYRQDGSPEVDAAWAALGVNCVIRPPIMMKDGMADTGIRSKRRDTSRSSNGCRASHGSSQSQRKVRRRLSSQRGRFASSALSGMFYMSGCQMEVRTDRWHRTSSARLCTTTSTITKDLAEEHSKTATTSSGSTCVSLPALPCSPACMLISYFAAHCLDIVRQQLMCSVDIGVLGQVWFQPGDEKPEAYVDFNTQHKCRNFNAVRQWAEERQIPEDVPGDFLEPPKMGDTIYHEIP